MMKRTQRVAFAAAVSLAISIGAVSAIRTADAGGAPSNAPTLTPDKGSFKILVNGQQVGKEEFEIGQNGSDWFAHGTSEVQSPDGPVHISGTLQFHADGSPVHYQWSTEGKKKASAAISFNNLTATIETQMEGAKPYTQQFTFNSSPIAVLDNNLYHQYAVLAHLYDREKKGPQTFSVLVPQELTPGTVTVDSLGMQDVSGKKLEELTVKTADLEIDLYLDNGKLVRLVAPGNNAEIVRN
jgi:hypothetical protein